jgi:hypothetical protein
MVYTFYSRLEFKQILQIVCNRNYSENEDCHFSKFWKETPKNAGTLACVHMHNKCSDWWFNENVRNEICDLNWISCQFYKSYPEQLSIKTKYYWGTREVTQIQNCPENSGDFGYFPLN